MMEENDKLKEVSRINDNDIQINRSEIMDLILSDERCDEEITKYFNKVIKTGDYYTFAAARKIIMEKTSRWEKTDRLIQTLDLVRNYGGISKVKRTLQGKKLEDFRRSLRELAELGINPVTIPGEWGIENIPNLLANYKKLCREENAKEIIDEIKEAVDIIIIDFHAEATAEKIALGYYLDGDATIIFGTHTHVQTADEKILEKGTGYITDVGMTGPKNSVIGMEIEASLKRFVTTLPEKYRVAKVNVF